MIEIKLLPYITLFTSGGLTLEGIQQKHVAESWHQQDNDEAVYQWASQTSGWPVSLIALREGDSLLGFITETEYNILQSIKNTPQQLTLVHPDAPGNISVLLDIINLVKLYGSEQGYGESLYTGSLNFRTI